MPEAQSSRVFVPRAVQYPTTGDKTHEKEGKDLQDREAGG